MTPLPKICHTYPAVMKLGTGIPYLKEIKKNVNHVTHPLSSAYELEICSRRLNTDFTQGNCFFGAVKLKVH